MRLTEEQRKAVMKERDALRPCRTCRWRKTGKRGCKEALGCVHSEYCNYAHDGWEPFKENNYKNRR
jgi:hypothetical protein